MNLLAATALPKIIWYTGCLIVRTGDSIWLLPNSQPTVQEFVNYHNICTLLCCLILNVDLAVADPVASGNLAYVASYRGLFSAGFRLDIAAIALTIPSLDTNIADIAETVLTLTTRDFSKVELFFPMRFCYRSKFIVTTLTTQQADWWSRLSNKATRGRMAYDNPHHRVAFAQVERKLNTSMLATDPGKQKINDLLWASAPDPDLHTLTLPNAKIPIMDRLTMLHWLRRHKLAPGMIFDLPVSDGHKLLGFHIEVEGTESMEWAGTMIPSFRIRLQPKFRDDSDDSPTWMWLTQDAQRLPLLFNSSHAFGTFAVRLVTATTSAPTCIIPEAAALELPTP